MLDPKRLIEAWFCCNWLYGRYRIPNSDTREKAGR